jgi:hypothetical protein
MVDIPANQSKKSRRRWLGFDNRSMKAQTSAPIAVGLELARCVRDHDAPDRQPARCSGH